MSTVGANNPRERNPASSSIGDERLDGLVAEFIKAIDEQIAEARERDPDANTPFAPCTIEFAEHARLILMTTDPETRRDLRMSEKPLEDAVMNFLIIYEEQTDAALRRGATRPPFVELTINFVEQVRQHLSASPASDEAPQDYSGSQTDASN
jgi:hypothetical protein